MFDVEPEVQNLILSPAIRRQGFRNASTDVSRPLVAEHFSPTNCPDSYWTFKPLTKSSVHQWTLILLTFLH